MLFQQGTEGPIRGTEHQ